MKTLAHFKKGDIVAISCYKKGCEGISMPVILGEEYRIHSFFAKGGGVGRFHWPSNAIARGFDLGKSFGGSGYCNCPNCQTQFAGVIIVSDEKGEKAIIFGYEPEPA